MKKIGGKFRTINENKMEIYCNNMQFRFSVSAAFRHFLDSTCICTWNVPSHTYYVCARHTTKDVQQFSHTNRHTCDALIQPLCTCVHVFGLHMRKCLHFTMHSHTLHRQRRSEELLAFAISLFARIKLKNIDVVFCFFSIAKFANVHIFFLSQQAIVIVSVLCSVQASRQDVVYHLFISFVSKTERKFRHCVTCNFTICDQI